MSRDRACLFCGKTLATAGKAKEHVFPQWLQRQLGLQDQMVATSWELPFDAGVLNSRRMDLDSLVLGTVCANCNNGWMSRLENEVKPILQLFTVAGVSRTMLERTQAKVMASWALKTAITLNRSSNYRRLFTPQDLHNLMVTGAPGLGHYVDLLWHSGPPEVSWLQTRGVTLRVHRSASAAPDDVYASMNDPVRITFNVGGLTFRVLSYDHRRFRVLPNSAGTVVLWPEPQSHVALELKHPVDLLLHSYQLTVAVGGSSGVQPI